MRSTGAIKTFNTLLILLGFALVAYSYPKLFSHSDFSANSDVPNIGKILNTTNDARLKKSYLFNWDQSYSGDIIQNNDLIFTNENSQAEFELSQGQKIALKSQTLIKLKEQSLEVKNGEVELSLADNSQELKILVGQKEYTLRSNKFSKLKVSASNGQSRFQVSQGEVRISSQNIDLTAKAGEEVLADADDASKALANIQILSPKDELYILSKDQGVEFKALNAPKDATALITGPNNNSINRQLDTEVILGPGEYTWSVAKGEKLLSHPANFQVLQKISAPSPLAPGNLEEVLTYEQEADVLFRWQSDQDVIFQILDEFGNIFYSGEVSKSEKTISFPSDGLYRWRIKAINENQESDWSETRKLIVRTQEYQEGEAVVIELKRPNQLAEFSWDGDAPKGSVFKLSKTKDFKNLVGSQNLTEKNHAKVHIPEVGVYYWKVETSGDRSLTLRPKKVLIRPTPPPEKPQAPPALKLKLKPKKRSASLFSFFTNAYAENFEEVMVAFDPIEDAKLYEVEIYADKTQQRLVTTIQTETPNFKWTPPRAGSYTWRIRFQDHWGRWSPFSDSSDLAASMDSSFNKKAKRKTKKKKQKKLAKKLPLSKSISKEVKSVATYKNSLAGFYAPAQMSYENKKERDIRIDGTALGGHGIEYLRNGSWIGKLSYYSNYGKVFDDQEFSQRSLSIGAGMPLGSFALGVSALAVDISDFEINGNQAQASSRNSSIGLGVFAQAQFNIGAANPLKLEAAYHGLELTHTSFALSYDFSLKERLLLETMLRGEALSVESKEDEINSQSFQAIIGPKYLF